MINMLPSRRITRAVLDIRLQRHVEQLRSAGFLHLVNNPAITYSYTPSLNGGGGRFLVRANWDAEQVKAVNAVLTLQRLPAFDRGLYE